MVRERKRSPLGLAVLAGLGLSPLVAGSANAQLLTLDLRVAGGGKTAAAPGVGGVVNLEIWAVVQNADNNHANDGFLTGQFNVLSNDSVGSLLGNLAPVTYVGAFANPSASAFLSQGGSAQNLDANGDLEVGGSNPNDVGVAGGPNHWAVATGNDGSAMAIQLGTGAGAGVTEFLLGTTSWTVTSAGTPTTTLNLGLRNNTTEYVLPYNFRSDGVNYQLRYDGLNASGGNSGAIGLGAAVTLGVGATSATWTGSGNWGTGGNWSGGTAPTAAGDTATFGTGASPVNVEAGRSVGTMNFSSAGHTISGPGVITLDATAGSAAVNVTAGTHTVSAPVTLADAAAVDVAGGSAITFSNLTSTGQGITKTGAGTLTVNAVRNSAALNVQAGTVAISVSGNTNANTSKVASLTVNTGASARLNIGDSDVIVDYTGGTVAGNIRSLLQSGYAGGAWTGPGIGTSAPLGGQFSIGYAESSQVLGVSGGTFSGQSADGEAILVKFTYAGDANLDGKVDIGDLGLLAGAWQQLSGKVWFDGDFTYDGAVDIGDLGLLAGNWQKGTAGNPSLPQMDFNAALAQFSAFDGVAVPEPTSLSLLALGGLALGCRRRK